MASVASGTRFTSVQPIRDRVVLTRDHPPSRCHRRNWLVTIKGDVPGVLEALRPIRTIKRTITYGLRNVCRTDPLATFQISNRPTHFQYSIVRSRGESLLDHRSLQHLFASRVDLAACESYADSSPHSRRSSHPEN